VATNFRNRISMQQMRNCVMDLNPPPPPPIFVASGWERVSFFIQVWCVEWTIQCSLSTWTVDSRLSMQVFGRGGFKATVPTELLTCLLIAPHFYPICFGKCCPPFTCMWAKGEELYLSK
jgi:hypothetical protein